MVRVRVRAGGRSDQGHGPVLDKTHASLPVPREAGQSPKKYTEKKAINTGRKRENKKGGKRSFHSSWGGGSRMMVGIAISEQVGAGAGGWRTRPVAASQASRKLLASASGR